MYKTNNNCVYERIEHEDMEQETIRMFGQDLKALQSKLGHLNIQLEPYIDNKEDHNMY